ncbi:MAG: glycosyltransferase family 9 protein [Alphaproteobacteria bacterium]|nr:glycosyltransferase family 9 protein [Alphaproteobacteria bacterium]
MSNILVIKHSALGDFVQAMRSFAAIRAFHPKGEDKITLLTTSPYADFARKSPYFDEVIVDSRPKLWDVAGAIKLIKVLNAGNYSRVYDLQTSNRSSFYFNLMGRKPEWSGIAKRCSHPHVNEKRDNMHTLERQAEQLNHAGITEIPSLADSLAWASDPSSAVDNDQATSLASFNLPDKIALIVPGGAPHRTEKRWSASKYGELSNQLLSGGVTPVVLGTESERKEIDTILSVCSGGISLAGNTSFLDIAALAKKALCAVGNDTGPMHLISSVGCSSAVLYSHASNPELCGQRGENVKILRKENLSDVSVEEVAQEIAGWIR